MSVRIRTFVAKDALSVAELHRLAIPRGFLSELGDSFLGRLYTQIARARGSCVLVAADEEDGCVVGFVSGSVDIKACYRHVLLKGSVALIRGLLPNLFRATVIKRILQTLLYPVHNGKGDSESERVDEGKCRAAELLSIAVADEARGKGVGRLLVDALEDFFRRHGHPMQYKVVTDAEDHRSNAFYQARGFTFQGAFQHHEHRMHRYVKKLPIVPTDTPER